MAGYPYTGTPLVGKTGQNKTGTSLSTNILIKVGNVKVGVLQKLSISEQTSIKMIHEVGTDGPVDSCREKAVEISGSADRIRMNRIRLAEAFGMPFQHLHSQVYPFDLTIIDRQSAASSNWIVTVVKNVWFDSIKYDYGADNYIITDSSSWKAEAIYTTLGGNGNKSAVTGGSIGLKPFYESGLVDDTTGGMTIERAADVGMNNRRGALDMSGIIMLGE
jgi:hypothetical protein